MMTPILKYFEYAHLPEKLQGVSKPIGDLAKQMDEQLPDCAEKSAGLRKLLEAKDCFVRAALAVLLLLTLAPVASAQDRSRPTPELKVGDAICFQYPEKAAVYPSPQCEAVVTAPAPVQQAARYLGDPYGFTGWLNGVRAQYGRGPVGFDPNLAAWAASNNGQQHARGMGHHVMGPARRQNSGMGGSCSTVAAMWMSSPLHRAALLDPTITTIGIAFSGTYWTFSAY